MELLVIALKEPAQCLHGRLAGKVVDQEDLVVLEGRENE